MPAAIPILRRPDGSFLINNGMYHVPNEDEWAEQWQALNAHAAAHPQDVIDVGFDYISPASGAGGRIPMFPSGTPGDEGTL